MNGEIKMNMIKLTKRVKNLTIILSAISIILANAITYYMLTYTHYVYEQNPIMNYLHIYKIMYIFIPLIEIIIVSYAVNIISKINTYNLIKMFGFIIILITLYIDSINDLYYFIHFIL